MKYIVLSQGKQALVDDEDYPLLSSMKWFYHAGYAVTHFKTEECIKQKLSMHRFLLGTPSGMEGDHINRNKLDNRRDNLRNVTKSLNCLNRGKKGYRQRGNSWYAYIEQHSKRKTFGPFKSEFEAYQARQTALEKAFQD